MRKNGPNVVRYTIDNCYGDALVTLLRTELVHGLTNFTDSPENWEDETLLTEQPNELAKRLAVPTGGPIVADFRPGRVFLRGRIRLVVHDDALTGFSVDEGAPEIWLRIDQLPFVKDGIKQLYSDLLTRRGRSD